MEKNVLLPKTSFGSKSEWKEKEPKLLKFWKDENVFDKRSESNTEGTFNLHDGPPYANGKLHLGHFLNKLLKDSFMKFNLMQGKKVNMKLGFDCHGLPTELEVLKLNNELSNDDTLLRKKCFSFSKNQMEKQLKQMEKWGLTCDWNPYYTTEKNYESKELEMLFFFLNNNLLYQEKRPVWYSPTSKSVLAESELEYKEVETNTLYVKFLCEDFYFLAWTTQPWTLLGNKGLGVNPDMLYKKVLYNNEYFVVESTMDLGETVSEFLGSELVGKHYTNLFDNATYKVVKAEYVKSGSGTGVVHLCPMHGEDDFETLKASYDNLVDSEGLLNNGLYWEDSFEYMKELSLSNNSFFKEEKYKHDYPFDWRSKRKVLMMLENQFFLDLKPMKRKVKKVLESVQFSDEKSKNRLVNTVLSRERWCLSRQRKWGFPLALFLKDGLPFVNQDSQAYLVELFKEKGSLVWFESNVEDLLPENLKHLSSVLTKCEFTMDVWFDSSVSWYSVMNNENVDMYLEGSDQSRGWFQGSLLTCLGKEKKSPFKKLFTHGFVLDSEGRKMSKSLGNVVEVEDLMKDYNSDVLRLWVYISNVKGDVKWSKEMMEKCGESYFKLRNTLKFVLGNLYGYNGETFEKNEKDSLGLSLTTSLELSCKEEMDMMNLRGVYENLMNFVREYSSTYLDLELKSDLYEAELTDEKRLRKQEVLYKGLLSLLKVLAYVTPYLAEDAYQNLPDNLRKQKSVFFL